MRPRSGGTGDSSVAARSQPCVRAPQPPCVPAPVLAAPPSAHSPALVAPPRALHQHAPVSQPRPSPPWRQILPRVPLAVEADCAAPPASPHGTAATPQAAAALRAPAPEAPHA
ncbi:hypothetical protein GUJ93_ZPchr0001g29995 [Zizania palustris]|uniref:Uncharacterized protein n=1 Tax=Zizania palustris TaxID=103762 RepID=A0A8J5RG60_ZIZPA|nr:hypothetical protein GUJ93_ZPchr0001g29995 [Zizania palustris]